MTRSSTKKLITPFENPESVFRSKKRLFETPGRVESSSPEFNLFSDIEEHSEEETTEIMTETIEQYMSKTHGNYGSGIARPKIGPHYTKDCPFKEEGKNFKEAYYIQFGTPYQPGGQYRATGPGFYQHNNGNSSFPDRRQTLEESLTKFMAESAKTQEENSNIIKEIQASIDASIRNQRASIKTLEIQIGQMSKVLQERGFGSLPGSKETNPRDHVKLISTAKADLSVIHRIGSGPYEISDSQYSNIFFETVPFPK
nr:hypothetical protein [Tanacetum cinerariifolium]